MIPGTQCPGHVVANEAATVSAATQDWILISRSNFSTSAASAQRLTMLVDMTETFQPRFATRVHDKTGVEYNDNNGQISNYYNITGTTGVLDSIGRLYFTIVSEGAGAYHVDVYNRSSRAAGALVAHTASYTLAGDQNLTADNASGIGGKITISAVVAADADIYVEFYKYGVVKACAAATLDIYGAPLDATAGRIVDVWWRKTGIHTITTAIPGRWDILLNPALISTFLFSDQTFEWPAHRLCHFAVYAQAITVTGTKPTVNVMIDGNKTCTSGPAASDGLQILAQGVYYRTENDFTPQYLRAAPTIPHELRTTLGGLDEDADANLTVEEVYVEE